MAEQKESFVPSFRFTYLSYFGAGARGEGCRLAAGMSGIAFEEVVEAYSDQKKFRDEGKRRWWGLPELTLFNKNGKQIAMIGKSNLF